MSSGTSNVLDEDIWIQGCVEHELTTMINVIPEIRFWPDFHIQLRLICVTFIFRYEVYDN